jgi:histidinol-phosphate/aromatic aminotransferase/cobyric acid decarboxylase-like protein
VNAADVRSCGGALHTYPDAAGAGVVEALAAVHGRRRRANVVLGHGAGELLALASARRCP